MRRDYGRFLFLKSPSRLVVTAGVGRTAVWGGWVQVMPVIDTFLKEHLFADIFARDILDHRSRELATAAALSSMKGMRGQLQFHLGAATNVGLTERR